MMKDKINAPIPIVPYEILKIIYLSKKSIISKKGRVINKSFIATATKISKKLQIHMNNVVNYVKLLEKEGFISKEKLKNCKEKELKLTEKGEIHIKSYLNFKKLGFIYLR